MAYGLENRMAKIFTYYPYRERETSKYNNKESIVYNNVLFTIHAQSIL